ncbi:hypothetical protein PSACC_03297 [Paramicrosporidium saccamoebae]|uniref:Uncharacterized protein n=1 Tax=Paramicrosporidium saccamoebae TaxID=1246581 RepID=A0A2H9TGC3_9FUNG|nr:hypothetical protein PSACC_03297 [Paramicrosporidium saccamoebae]
MPTESLIQLLGTVEGELADECQALLSVLFETADFSSVLSTYGPYLEAALQSERPAMLRMGIDLCQKALVPYSQEISDAVLRAFVLLLAHPDTAIYQRVEAGQFPITLNDL